MPTQNLLAGKELSQCRVQREVHQLYPLPAPAARIGGRATHAESAHSQAGSGATRTRATCATQAAARPCPVDHPEDRDATWATAEHAA